ncbi:MAG: GntR family transcriptional regulator [Psychrobium sp.]|nr:GntR family transcriptional regulator [Psychrobium sp.]
MHISINLDDDEPLFSQLMSQIKAAVQSKHLTSGVPLPSIRQLANDLDINNKTVAKPYRLLERDSVLESKEYRGTFVHPNAKYNCDFDLGLWVNNKLAGVISELRASAVTDSEIRIAFTRIMNNRLS